MKIILLLFTLCLSVNLFAQRYSGLDKLVIKVNSPASVKGSYKVMGTVDSLCYAFLYGKGGNYWGIKDVTKTSITGKFVLVNDSTGVNIINAVDLVGNIAVVYYGGGIKYKQKMINIQAAGAAAMVLIMDKDGAESYAGGEGDAAAMAITIPMFVIQNSDGKKLANVLKTEVVNGYVGLKSVAKNDIKLNYRRALTPARLTNVTALVQQDDVIDSLGIFVYNNGSETQDSVLCEVLIKFGADTLHHEFRGVVYRDSILDKNGIKVDSITTKINPGKSVGYITFKPFKNKENLKAGKYTLTYSAFSTVKGKEDDFKEDNKLEIPFYINDTIYSPTVIDSWNRYVFKDSLRDSIGKPVTPAKFIYDTLQYKNQPNFTTFYKPGSNYKAFGPCLVFRDANASRINGVGLNFTTMSYSSADKKYIPLKGELFKINVYEWADKFSGFEDTLKYNNLIPLVDNKEYIATTSNYWDYLSVRFDDEVKFEDDKRYLICVLSSNPNIRFAYDTVAADLYSRMVFYDQPLNMVNIDGNYYGSGFGSHKIPSMTLNVKAIQKSNSLNEIDKVKNNVIVYPNPANDFVNIAYKSTSDGQPVEISVTDMTGKVVYFTKVDNSSVGTNVFGFDTEAFTNGIYVVNVSSNDGNATRKLSIQK
jgi:hypothetical protein